ncbi:hypothetical protein L1887_20369 [Cichorium endivia]|nr:hypothetical protein L1887_20369 [Cichorium endivia]
MRIFEAMEQIPTPRPLSLSATTGAPSATYPNSIDSSPRSRDTGLEEKVAAPEKKDDDQKGNKPQWSSQEDFTGFKK